jgi:hypothetical protein
VRAGSAAQFEAWVSRALVSSARFDEPVPAAGVLEVARAGRVHLLLAARLGLTREYRSNLPAGVADRLTAECRVAAVEEAARTRELSRVVTSLDSAGCAPIVFKGAALAYTHYEQPWLRPRIDSDVLIDPARRSAAELVFQQLGYARPPFVSGRLVMYQEPFVRAEAGGLEHVCDLHWRVANPQAVADVLAHAELRQRAVAVAIPGGGRFHAPCPVDALLIACVHRAAHHGDAQDLLWLYDIHLLAERCDEHEWHAFAAAAAARGVAAICDRGLALSAARFGTRVPGIVAELAQRRAGAEPSAVFLTGGVGPVDRLASDLRALGARDRVRLLHEVLFPPRSYMRARFGEHTWLPWLYVRRIVTGAARWLKDWLVVRGS